MENIKTISCLANWLLLLTVVNCVGTSLQEIKVDCDIDDRASIAITKKGKVWEVSQWNVTLLGKSCAIIWTHFLKCRMNYLIVSYCFSCWRIYAATINLDKMMFFFIADFSGDVTWQTTLIQYFNSLSWTARSERRTSGT